MICTNCESTEFACGGCPQEPCGCLLGPLHTEADHRDLTKGDTA